MAIAILYRVTHLRLHRFIYEMKKVYGIRSVSEYRQYCRLSMFACRVNTTLRTLDRIHLHYITMYLLSVISMYGVDNNINTS